MAVVLITNPRGRTRALRCRPRVAERIAKQNPGGVMDGCIVRGWHRKADPKFEMGLVSARDVITKFGREAWECTPNGLKFKYGKRKYLSREAFLDTLPLLYVPGARPLPLMQSFPTRRYANDPRGCPVEFVKRAA